MKTCRVNHWLYYYFCCLLSSQENRNIFDFYHVESDCLEIKGKYGPDASPITA